MYHFDDDEVGGSPPEPERFDEDGISLDMHRRAMLQIKVLDPDACILLSKYTLGWYVSAKVEVSNGTVLSGGGAEHTDTPTEAVMGYFQWLCDIGFDEVIVTRQQGERQHWRWNGAAFRPDHYWKPPKGQD